MAEPFERELFNTVRNAFCTALEAQQNYYGYVGRNPFFITARMAEALMGAAYRTFCNREPPPPPEPSFTGGQCATMYDVTLLKNAILGNGNPKPGYPDSITVRGMGPVEGFSITQDPGSVQVIFVNFADGDDYAGNLNLPDEQFVNCAITNIVRLDGLPDDCGDPPIPTPTPDPGFNEGDTNITYTNNEGVDITVPLIFIFADLNVNLKGELTVPVRIDLGGLDFKIGGELNLNNNEINLNFGNKNYNRNGLPNPDGYKPDPNLPDVPDDVPDDVYLPSPDDTDDETSRILRACIVSTNNVPDDISIIYQTGNPNITAPNLGYVSFCISVNGSLSWTSDIPVKNQRNFIVCPWEGGAVAVRGTPRPGVTWVITPVYAAVEDVIQFA